MQWILYFITAEKDKEHMLAVSEEKLWTFFENSQGLMCTHDLNGEFLSVNSAGAAMLGYTVAEISKMSLFDIVPEDRHVYLKEYLSAIIQQGKVNSQS